MTAADLAHRAAARGSLDQWLADIREGLTVGEWLDRNTRRADAWVTGHCTVCANVEEPGWDGLKGRLVKAVYQWVWADQLIAEEMLCEPCCAWMREHYTPLRVNTLSG